MHVHRAEEEPANKESSSVSGSAMYNAIVSGVASERVCGVLSGVASERGCGYPG